MVTLQGTRLLALHSAQTWLLSHAGQPSQQGQPASPSHPLWFLNETKYGPALMHIERAFYFLWAFSQCVLSHFSENKSCIPFKKTISLRVLVGLLAEGPSLSEC